MGERAPHELTRPLGGLVRPLEVLFGVTPGVEVGHGNHAHRSTLAVALVENVEADMLDRKAGVGELELLHRRPLGSTEAVSFRLDPRHAAVSGAPVYARLRHSPTGVGASSSAEAGVELWWPSRHHRLQRRLGPVLPVFRSRPRARWPALPTRARVAVTAGVPPAADRAS